MLALKGNRCIAFEQANGEFERIVQHFIASIKIIKWDAELFMFTLLPACAHTEYESAFTEGMHGIGIAHRHRGMAEGDRRNQRAKLNPLRMAGSIGERSP